MPSHLSFHSRKAKSSGPTRPLLKMPGSNGHVCTLSVLPLIIVRLSHQTMTLVSAFQWGHPTPRFPRSPLEWTARSPSGLD